MKKRRRYPETVSSQYVVDAVRKALPGTRIELAGRVFRSGKSVGKALRYLVSVGKAHVSGYRRGNNRFTAVYAKGRGPATPVAKPIAKTGRERMKEYRDRCKQDGSWEDLMARDRALKSSRRPPKRDPAAVALFGLPAAGDA